MGADFALVHFSDRDSFQTDVFRPGAYTAADKMAAAECFFGGGTNFETPMREALRLMEQEGFENADVVFIIRRRMRPAGHIPGETCQRAGGAALHRDRRAAGPGQPAWTSACGPLPEHLPHLGALGDEIVRRLVDQRV